MIIDRIFHKINSSKSHPYLYLSPHVYGFGNSTEDIYAGLIRVKYAKKKLIILCPFDIPFIFKYKLTNRALFDIKSEYIVDQGRYTFILSRTLMTIIYMPLRVFGLLLRKFSSFNLIDSYHFPNIGRQEVYAPEKTIKKFSLESVQESKWSKNINEKIIFNIRLNANVNDGYEYQKIGIPKNSWFVCLHVRGSGFRDDGGRCDYRNPNILNYIPAIKEITSRGGWVVRLGDNGMKPLPTMENVIDYPFTGYKSETMDLCLIQSCRFFIGTMSGPLDFARLAYKNILLTNMYNWHIFPSLIKDRGILQHVYSKRDKRYLSIKELLSMDLKVKNFPLTSTGFIDGTGFNDDNYVFTENNKEEISMAVLEYIDFLNNGDLTLTSKQKEYIEYRREQGQRLLSDVSKRFTPSKKTHSDEDEMRERFRLAVRFEAAKGTLCAGFLEEHW